MEIRTLRKQGFSVSALGLVRIDMSSAYENRKRIGSGFTQKTPWKSLDLEHQLDNLHTSPKSET
jgi:hypothetical protein